MDGTRRIESRITLEPSCRSAEVALQLGALADVHRQLAEVAAALTPEQLAWQRAPGENTLGMLFAHVAVSEVHLGFVGLKGESTSDVQRVLGIGLGDDGMPLPPGSAPPAMLSGRDGTFFVGLLERALEHTRSVARDLDDARLTVPIVRPPRPDGTVRVFDRRWSLFHLVEHAAQHLGQAQLLRRLVEALPKA